MELYGVILFTITNHTMVFNVAGMENQSGFDITTIGQSSENENTSAEENLHIFPKMFGISFVTGAIILSIIALICVIKQFCCKKVAKNYAYRKLS